MPTIQYIDTGEAFTSAISTLEKLLQQNKQTLQFHNLYKFDQLLIKRSGDIALVFDGGSPRTVSLGKRDQSRALGGQQCRCAIMDISINIYWYFEAFNPGRDTYNHIKSLGILTRLLYENDEMLGLSVGGGTGVTVTRSELVARRVQTDMFLAGLVAVDIPVRF